MDGLARIQKTGFAAFDRQHVESSAAIEEQKLPVTRPVGRFETLFGMVDDAPLAAVQRDNLQAAFHGPLRQFFLLSSQAAHV